MTRLVIIADDLTGALDTCVQFAKWGSTAKVVTACGMEDEDFSYGREDVLVVDAETRHISPEDAYTLMHTLVSNALAAGIAYLYIKADSGLRGNIAAALQAALDASGRGFIGFLPAFPEMNRITRGGVQYIDGVPIHKSVFAEDPFEPVCSPEIQDLFEDVPAQTVVLPLAGEYQTDFAQPTIGIFDAESVADFHRAARHLQQKNQLSIVAGCAGFAAVLPELIGLSRRQVPLPSMGGRSLLVFCGSLSPITRRQLEYGERLGYKRIQLTPRQQIENGWFDTDEGQAWLKAHANTFMGGGVVLVDTGISQPEATEEYLAGQGLRKEDARVGVSQRLGGLIRRVLELGCGDNSVLMVVGGDTMLGFMQQVEWREITPLCEVETGAVLSRVQLDEGAIWVISKSGGFGGENMLELIYQKLGHLTGKEDAV